MLSSGRMRARPLAIAPLIAFLGCAEDDPGIIAVDAAPLADAARGALPDAAPADASDPLSWVDFAIIGCEVDETESQPPCVGRAPLTLRFVALAPATIDVYRWSFGDDSGQSIAPSPERTFELPGDYDVSLTVGGPGGTARAEIEGAVRVEPAPLGATCEVGLQCETESCVCGGGDCEPPLAAGMCSTDCDAANPCALGVCADLAAAEPDAPAPWQRALCLPGCEDDGDCPAGRACMDLPTGDGSGDWVRGCFAPELLAPIGGSCLDGRGEPRHDRCASGLCVAEGARGLCSATCDTESPCPASAACATFNDAGRDSLCVHRCDGDGELPCGDDPWLACEATGASGELGFEVDGDPSDAGYCAPRACDEPEDCGPDGACIGGYCGPL